MHRIHRLFASTIVVCLMATNSISFGQAPNVLAWGYNYDGQLGNGVDADTVSRRIPVRVTGLNGITKVAAGGDPDGGGLANHFSLALKSDGTVWAWGANHFGELGNGGNANSNVPVQVSGLSRATAISGGGRHALALMSDGTVWAWGDNSSGQLGNRANANSAVPVLVPGLTKTVAIAAGDEHSLALESDGTVWAWGGTRYIEREMLRLPVRVSGLTDVVSIAAGFGTGWAVKRDGTVWSWGIDLAAAPVNGLSGIVSIAGGPYHILGLKSGGAVWTWQNAGVIGPQNDGPYHYPQAVHDLTGVVVAAGGRLFSLALKNDGTVLAWGYNRSGQLGNGGIAFSDVPVPVSNLTGVVAIAGGIYHSLAVKSDGTVWAWGDNQLGELGNGMSAHSNLPQVILLPGVVAITGGGQSRTLALMSNGTVWAWGTLFGWRTSNVPVQVGGLSDVVAIAQGDHALILKADGTLWGLNRDGTLWGWGGSIVAVAANGPDSVALKSDGTVWVWEGLQSVPPVQVSGLTGVVKIAQNYGNSIALKSDGTVWAWANPSFGGGPDVPVQVNGLSNVVSIAGGHCHNLALKSDGSVWAWIGPHFYCGNGAPVQVSGLDGAIAVAAGALHSLAVKSDGTVWAWGNNQFGQLGDGSNTDSNGNVSVWRSLRSNTGNISPVQVSGVRNAVAVGALFYSSLAILAEGIPNLMLSRPALSFADRGTQTITITNGGAGTLVIRNIVITGIDPSDFSISGTCSGASLAPSASCNLSVVFSPAAEGSRTAALLLIANAPGSPILVPLRGAGYDLREKGAPRRVPGSGDVNRSAPIRRRH